MQYLVPAQIRLEAFPHITEEEYKLLIQNINEKDKKLLITILWSLGLRISEALSLKVSDLIKKQDGYYLRVKRLKKKSETIDNIPIPLELALEIEKYTEGKKIDDKLFNFTRQNAFDYIKRIGKKFLNRHIHPHMFRHGRVYQLIKQQVHPLLIIKIMGWSSLSVVLKYYHPSPDDIRAVLGF